MTDRLFAVLLRAAAARDGLPDRARPPLLRRSGVSIGRRTLITSGSRFAKFSPIDIGDDVYVNHDCYFDAEAPITIGDRSSIGDHVRFITATHEAGTSQDRAGKNMSGPIHVGPGTWIGSSSIILPGVTVGSGCVIAAGAVVNRDCVPDSLYAGVPARRVRPLD